jgi:hypothetical protein
MKKIKITVAALLLGGMSYAQCVSTSDLYCSCDSLSADQIADIEGISTSNTYKAQWAYFESREAIEDIIEWMHSDIQDGRVQEDVGEIYLQNLIDLLSKLEDINAGLITN